MFKVRATEKLYYDGIRTPGDKEGHDVFVLNKKEDFNPNFMEAIGWEPENKKVDDLFLNTDGSKKTAPQVAAIQSDHLDDNLRKARASKVEKEQAGFVAEVNKPKAEVL